jgi:peptide/nickel transport system ATP-binding protein
MKTMMNQDDVILEVKGLKTYFPLEEGTVKAVDGVDFEIYRDKTVCIVGESGCGKSVTSHSILQIVDPPGEVVEGEILFHRGLREGEGFSMDEVLDLAAFDPRSKEMRAIRGNEISMIFQEPMTALSPVHTIGDQIMEPMLLHTDKSKQEAHDYAVEILGRVGIPQPEDRINAYTFQLSGGMRQRAMIAMALACNPTMLIADEPTTALDVTTQAQILELMAELQDDYGMAIMYITHDLGVVAEIADEVVVMYLGWVVERADVDSIFHDPLHPYTKALLRSIPTLGLEAGRRLEPIRGMVPHPYNRPTGCVFAPRCSAYDPAACIPNQRPPKVVLEDGREVRCWHYEGRGEVVSESAGRSGSE